MECLKFEISALMVFISIGVSKRINLRVCVHAYFDCGYPEVGSEMHCVLLTLMNCGPDTVHTDYRCWCNYNDVTGLRTLRLRAFIRGASVLSPKQLQMSAFYIWVFAKNIMSNLM